MPDYIPRQNEKLSHHLPDESIPLLDQTLGGMLRLSAQQYPERAAIAWAIDDGTDSMSYSQLLAESEQIAFWLLQQAQPGDRISVWSRNSLEWALLEFGCALAGMVVAAWNPGWSDPECEHACALAEPALVLAGQDTRGAELLDRARSVAKARPVVALDELRNLAADAIPTALPQPMPADLFLIQFTSGTTGRAKGAALSHYAIVNSARLRTRLAGVDETDVWVNPSPLNHVGGAVSMLPGAILTGSCYVLMNKFDPGEYLRLIKLFGATRIGGVPTMLLAMLEHPNWDTQGSRLRSIGAGGAQVPQTLVERLTQDFAAPVLVTYGQSEYPIITLSAPDEAPWVVAETVGRVAPHVELKIVDLDSAKTVPLGESGEICVRGSLGMSGYYRAPEATANTIDPDGFLHTGDLGTLDKKGYLRILGRVRDVIIRGGENIYPAEVEDALLLHPDISEAAVVGIPDPRWGQQVGAAIRLKEGCQIMTEELEEHLSERLAHFKRPRHWLFVNTFPMTPSGKISKIEIEKLFASTND